MALAEPTKAWYWREFQSEVLSGPETFIRADRQARELSRKNNSGLAEVVTYENNQLMVVSTFLRGKLRYQGKRARDASRFNLPPTV